MMINAVQIAIGLVALYSIYLVIMYYFVRYLNLFFNKIKFRKAKKIFFEELRDMIKRGAIKELIDVTLVQASVAKNRRFSLFEYADRESLLKEYLLSDKRSFRLVKYLILKAQEEKPLSILSGDEQTQARELKEHIKEKDEVLAKNFENLVVSLGTKLRDANKNRSTYRLNLVSILIGVISIIIGILLYVAK
jgi:Ca2+/Na+ antiporter